MPYNPNEPRYQTGASRITSFSEFGQHRAEDEQELRKMRRNYRKRGETHQAPGERKHKWNRATHKIDDLSAEETSDRVEALEEASGQGLSHYMFFNNLKNICRMAREIMAMDPQQIDQMLDEHDWATDHIATSKDDMEEVYGWLAAKKQP